MQASVLTNINNIVFITINQSIAVLPLDYLFYAATLLGNGAIQGVIIIWFWVLSKPGSRGMFAGTTCLWSVLSSTAFVHILKNIFKTPRPINTLAEVRVLVDPLYANSFPSGHTATSFAMAAVVGSIFPKWRLPSMAIAVLIGLSRIYTGVHFPSDVLVSALIGTACGLGFVRIFTPAFQKKRKSFPN